MAKYKSLNKTKHKKSKSHQGRGMQFEKRIDNALRKLERDNIYIYKIPNDWVVRRAGAKIISAFPRKKSVCDFMGTNSHGLAIAIETKSHQSKTSFPFSNIADHQYCFFDKWCQVAIGYYLVEFKKLGRIFAYEAHKFHEHKKEITEYRKSMRLEWFEKHAVEIKNIQDLKRLINQGRA